MSSFQNSSQKAGLNATLSQAAAALPSGLSGIANPIPSNIPVVEQDIALAKRLAEKGDWKDVALVCQKALKRNPKTPALWEYCAYAALQLKQLDVAATAAMRAATLDPCVETFTRAGAFLSKAKLSQSALEAFEKAWDLAPNDAQTNLNLGQSLIVTGDRNRAEKHLETTLVTDPQNRVALLSLAECALIQGKTQQGYDLYGTVLETDPNDTAALSGQAIALINLGDFDGAIHQSRRSLKIEPHNVLTLHNLTMAYHLSGDPFQAVQTMEKSLFIEPDQPNVLAMKLHLQSILADWSWVTETHPQDIKVDQGGIAVPPFAFLNLADDPELQFERSKAQADSWAQIKRENTAPHDPPNARIRIGYFTADVLEHATLQLLNGVLRGHDKSKFEIFGYALNASGTDSPLASVFWQACDHKRLTAGQSDEAIVQRAREDRLDIAVDLKGYTLGSRTSIFAHGVAPVQVAYLGYPSTMGANFMDYLIADEIIIPPQERQNYSEKIAYLPHCYLPGGDARTLPNVDNFTRPSELPEEGNGFVFACLNFPYKIHPQIFDVWMDLLRNTNGSVLWLLERHALASNNLRREAEKRGISGDRLVFAKQCERHEHIARQAHADLMLDTVPINAHTTAAEGLWAGVPFITSAGRQFTARVCASFLTTLGLSDLIADDLDTYKTLALSLAHDPDRLQQIRTKITQARDASVIFNPQAYTPNLERIFETMVARSRAGDPPKDFHIAP